MTTKKYKIGYTAGVFDLFHVGHLNILKSAKEKCEKLIVGVSIDSLVSYKFKKAVIPFEERIEIVRSIKYVDEAIPQETMDKMSIWEELKFDVMFVGNDWEGTKKWQNFEIEFSKISVDIIFFPYTKGTSSSLLNGVLIKLRDDLDI